MKTKSNSCTVSFTFSSRRTKEKTTTEETTHRALEVDDRTFRLTYTSRSTSHLLIGATSTAFVFFPHKVEPFLPAKCWTKSSTEQEDFTQKNSRFRFDEPFHSRSVRHPSPARDDASRSAAHLHGLQSCPSQSTLFTTPFLVTFFKSCSLDTGEQHFQVGETKKKWRTKESKVWQLTLQHNDGAVENYLFRTPRLTSTKCQVGMKSKVGRCLPFGTSQVFLNTSICVLYRFRSHRKLRVLRRC